MHTSPVQLRIVVLTALYKDRLVTHIVFNVRLNIGLDSRGGDEPFHGFATIALDLILPFRPDVLLDTAFLALKIIEWHRPFPYSRPHYPHGQ